MARVAGRARFGSLSPGRNRAIVGLPTLTSISPEEGSEDGGTDCIGTGTGFHLGMTVTVGGVVAAVTAVPSPTTVQFTTGAGTGTDVAVVVATSHGSATLVDAYTYIGSGGVTLTFFDDWHGISVPTTTLATILGSKWDIISNNNSSGQIRLISASGLGFPAALENVLEINSLTVNNGASILQKSSGLTVPASGGTKNYRVYFRMDDPDDNPDEGTHPFQDGNAASDTNWMLLNQHTINSDFTFDPGTYGFQFWPGNGGQAETPENLNRWGTPVLTKGVAYRVEWQVHRISETEFVFYLKIYNVAGTLLFSDVTFTNNTPFAPGGTLTLADLEPMLLHTVANMAGLNLGCNGIENITKNFIYGYQGAPAIADGLAPGAVIGAYPVAGSDEVHV